MSLSELYGARGSAAALVFPHRIISYAELSERMDRVARSLGARRSLVAIVAENTEHAIVTYLAARGAGHAVALLPPERPDAASAFEKAFAPDVVFAHIDGRWRRMPRDPGPALHPDLALLLGTSGSTGETRFVRLSNGNLDANADSIARYLGLTASDRAALVLPFHYSYGLSVLNSHLAVGASVFVASRSILEPGFVEAIGDAGCTTLAGVPYSYELLEKIRFRDRTPPALRSLTVAGGRMPAELALTYGRHMRGRGGSFFAMYGQTEATARIAYLPPDRLEENPDAIGIAIPGGSLSLVDEQGAVVEDADRCGELVYRGPNVMMGYAESGADLARGAELTELRTGDLATRDAAGLYRIVGRLKRISKIGGLRISHDAVEAALRARGIEAAVTGDDCGLVAAFTSGHDADKVRAAMAQAGGVGGFHMRAVKLHDLPRLPSGKVDSPAILRLGRRSVQAPTGIADAFRVAFFPATVAPTDSFETLGGDSLVYVQLSMAVERQLGHLPQNWESRPIRDLENVATISSDLRVLDTALVLRALAILLVVVHHATLWPIPGGAAALMVLVGHGLARFGSRCLLAGDVRPTLQALAPKLAIYLPIVLGLSAVRGEWLWPSLLLVGNLGIFDPARMVPYLYWFVEAYVQVVLVWCALMLVAPVRRVAANAPFGFGMALVAVTVALKFVSPVLWPVGAVQIFTTPDVLYLTAIGWTAWFARGPRRAAVLLGSLAALLPVLAWTGGNWTGSWVKFALQGAVVALLVLVPRIAVPRWSATAILTIAAASFHIYLVHRLVPEWHLALPVRIVPPSIDPAVSVAIGLASGLLAFGAQKAAAAWLVGLKKRRRSARMMTPAE